MLQLLVGDDYMQLTQEKLALQTDLISKEMITIENELVNIIAKSDEFVRDKLKSLFYSGKRLRPKLVVLSGLCFSSLNKNMVYTAIAAELIHTASLVHDDIIDRSDYRRNMPTINYTSGNHVAVLAGDFLFAKAFEILSKNNLTKSMEYLVVAIQEMCSGEMLQARDLFNVNVTEDNYMDKTSRKTGALLSACCRAGAQNGGAKREMIEHFGAFGRLLGLAFQITDDLLDFTGSKITMGKPVAKDLDEGNFTLPIIYLLQDPKYKSKYEIYLKNKENIKDIKPQLLTDLRNSDALEKAYEKAKFFIYRAIEILDLVPSSIYKDTLLSLSKKVITRIY